MTELALDSNIAISILNGDLDLEKDFPGVLDFYLPVTVCGEILFGAKNSSKSSQNEQKCWDLIRACQIIHSTLLISEEYAAIRLELKKIGRPIPENDIWIAAACRSNQLPLASRDKHFSYITGLQLIHA